MMCQTVGGGGGGKERGKQKIPRLAETSVQIRGGSSIKSSSIVMFVCGSSGFTNLVLYGRKLMAIIPQLLRLTGNRFLLRFQCRMKHLLEFGK